VKIVAKVGVSVEIEMESPGRWIAEIPELPGVMAYGPTASAAAQNAKSLALSVFGGMIDEAIAEAKSQ
jgi:predicted RNase H-like HicB family nuclease